MVKSLTAIFIAALLLLGAGLFEWGFVSNEFGDFEEELQTLYDKSEERTANCEDAKSVRVSWEERKTRLHVWIPHNDITKIDDYLSEAVKLVGEREYSLALSKLEILIHLCEALPDTYRPGIENIF